MNKENRYVIRLGHPGTHQPPDQPSLLQLIRERLRPLEGQATNLRVSRTALEFDLFIAPEAPLHPYLSALESVGPVLTYKLLDAKAPIAAPAAILSEARQLFKEERYWEAHEVLEGLWKSLRGREKELIQALILVAAALVHAQRNEEKIVLPMLEEAARRLENQPASFLGIDVNAFARQLQTAIQSKNIYFPSI
jgi:predicted metal-dependent hydrolase